jgi:hypothetical protein
MHFVLSGNQVIGASNFKRLLEMEYDVMHCQRKCSTVLPNPFFVWPAFHKAQFFNFVSSIVFSYKFHFHEDMPKCYPSLSPSSSCPFLFGTTGSTLPLFKTTYNSYINHDANLCVQLTTELHVSVSKIPRRSLSPNLHY